MRVHIRWLIGATLIALTSLVAFVPTVHAATLHVTTCAGDTSPGSLGGTIAAASSGDTIVFDGNCTVTLTAPLTIPDSKNLTIDAGGHTVALDGGGAVQILHLQATNNKGPTVALNALTLQHGKAAQGGAIFNDQGTLTITNSAIIANTATTSGGGIENAGGVLKVTNSTFSGNTASGPGGATGGAIDNDAHGTATIVSSTISGNTVMSQAAQAAAGGGLFDFATVANSVTLTETIVAGNTGGNCNGADIGSANPNGLASGGHNLIGVRHNNPADPTCGVDFTGLAAAGEIVGTDASPVNPKLGPLGNNGGTTPTLPLRLGSPAIDAGGTCPAGVTTDQRGVTRPQGAACDIGAYESQGFTVQSVAVSGATPLKVGQTTPLTATGTYNDGSTANITGQVQWSSNNVGVATVDAAGNVTGESPGTATITATVNGKQGTFVVTVGAPTPIGITVSPVPAPRPSGAPAGSAPAPVPAPRTAPAPAPIGGAATQNGPTPAPIPPSR